MNLVKGLAKGATLIQLNLKDLRELSIISPPIEHQNKFAEIIKQIEQQKQLTQQSLQKSEELFQSLLQRAFKGELMKYDEYNFKKEKFSEAAENNILYNTK